MKKLLLTTALMLAATPAFAKDYTIKEVTNPDGGKNPYYFSPDKLTIQPGDTVTFENAQEDTHDVMFVNVPKAVDEMIMSPMMEKKGQKWSYKFTLPGTYQFHCHPHEALGMKGTIIVGQASKPGETKAMNHHKMGEHAEGAEEHHHDGTEAADHHDSKAATTGQPQGTGKVISVDAANNSIKLEHDPIKALVWPKMKMSFTADKSIDLSNFKEGDAVSFALKPVGKDDYTLIDLKKAP
jgi:plastocyanin